MNDNSNDTSFLKNLFGGRPSQPSAEPPKVTVPAPRRGMAVRESAVKKSTSVRGIQTRVTKRAPPGKQAPSLSPLASEILRDARSELGRDSEQQRIEFDTVATERAVAAAIDKALATRKERLSEVERADLIVHLRTDLLGWGILQGLIDDPNVTDIHIYDYRTVVCQRGKISESTGLHWPSPEAYSAFIDRLLLRMGKSLSTQQHTVDGAFEDGVRICAIHDSVCVGCGPLLSIRVPRLSETTLDMLVALELAPQVVIDYLASLTRSGQVTMIIAGETGTGKTTLLRGLGTQFADHESIVTVEDTPELNFGHPFQRALVSRPANVEGVGEVTLQEHIKSTLRMTPTRVILGEMRSPFAAEAFLESAQTGHTGISTVHARNAKETLVRLESLLGRAQKSVSVDIIRQQISLAVDVVVWMFRDKVCGKPRIGEIIEVGHFVEGSIQVKPIFRYDYTKEQPTWNVESWSSYFDSILAADGLYLGQLEPVLHCDEPEALRTPANEDESEPVADASVTEVADRAASGGAA